MKTKEARLQVFWKMRNGNLISVDEMDINHLRNVLKMILRSSKYYCEHCKYIVHNKKYPHRSMCPNNIINSDAYSYRESQFELNGDIAKSFNDDNYSDLADVQWSDGEFYKQ